MIHPDSDASDDSMTSNDAEMKWRIVMTVLVILFYSIITDIYIMEI